MPVKLSSDWDDFESGPYRAVNNVWNKGPLQNGPDFEQSITIGAGSFPDGVTMRWSWPGFKPEIYAYPEVIFGYKPWDPGEGTLKYSARVDALKKLEAHVDLDIAGETGKFDVALELWLTDRKGGGPEDITTEVMVWLHAGDLTPAGAPRTDYRDGGYKAAVYVQDGMGDNSGDSPVTWRYIALKPDKDHLDGVIDLRAVLVALRKDGLISGREWVGGFELGAEVAGGKGRMTIESFDADFAAHRVTGSRDVLKGKSEADLIDGRGGNDRLYGKDGADELRGGRGADRLDGGDGRDVLRGGDGRDSFVFSTELSARNIDRIADFTPGQDRILLKGSVFDLKPGALKGKAFDLGKTADGSRDRILYDSDGGKLAFDPDGAGGKKAMGFAKVARGLDLDADDFLII